MPAFHPAILFRREILGDKPYNTSYRLAADYDLICRLLKNNAVVKQLAAPVSIYHRGGISDIEGDLGRAEENEIRLEFYRLPGFVGSGIKQFKAWNAKPSLFSKFIRQLRKRI